MQLNIKKRYFYRLEGVSSLKAHIEKLNNLEVTDNLIKGNIEINISYTDIDGMECFKVIPYPFEVEMDEIKPIDVNLGNVRILVVENQGFDIECDLVINYLNENLDVKKEIIELEPVIEVEPITNVTFDDDNKEEEIYKIKEDISKNYEDKLAETLNSRDDNVLLTKSYETRSNFLSFLVGKKEKKYCLKSIYVEKEDDLNKISKEYKIPMSELLKGYDRNFKRVIFKVDK